MLKIPENIILIEEKSEYTYSELKKMFSDSKLCICDLYIQGTEDGVLDTDIGMIDYENVLNIDHHTPLDYMYRNISSTTIAINYVNKNGPLSADTKIIINHVDADSLLSSLIMAGILEPDDIYNVAAISADHTGYDDPIANLLQVLERKRDVAYSISELDNLLNDKPLQEDTDTLLRERADSRDEIKRLVLADEFSYRGDIAYITLDNKIESELVPEYLPDAKVVMLASPMPDNPSKWEIKVRLGQNGKGILLKELNLPDFGCRFNAGSTFRHGGTYVSPEEFLKILVSELKRVYGSTF